MRRTELTLSLILTILISMGAATRNVKVAFATSPVWVEVAKISDGVASGKILKDDLDLFSVSHLEWRVRWSIVP